MSPRSCFRPLFSLILLTALAGACAQDIPTEPERAVVLAAKGGNGGGNGGGGSDPTVDGVDPVSAPQDTTLDVRVFGSNFDDGSSVALLLDGSTTKKVKTNATTFVSATELVANITIDADAEPDLYDVQVTTSRGKKGIGIEMFEIEGTTADLLNRPSSEPTPAALYEDGFGFYVGDFNVNLKSSQSEGNYNVKALCEEGRSFDFELPKNADGNPVWTFSGPRSVCSGDGAAHFHVPDLLNAECPDGQACPIGAPEPEGSNYSPVIYYYFAVDANNDGTFNSKRFADERYNVVWTDGMFEVVARGTDGVSCAWRVTANTADLWKRDDIAIDTSGRAVALDATIRRHDGPCAFAGSVTIQ